MSKRLGGIIMKVLNVAEKNDAAKNIAGLLSRGTSQKREGFSKFNKLYCFQVDVPQLGGHCDMTMTSVSGHLMDFDFPEACSNWGAVQPYSLFDTPINERVNKNGLPIKKTLEQEARKSQALIIWTDGDREGENIGFEIIRVCCGANRNLRILRARFSEITTRSMNLAIRNLLEPDEKTSQAVDIRRELDLRFGAVFTRFQTLLLRDAGVAGLGQYNNNNNNNSNNNNNNNRNNNKRPTSSVVSYGPCQFPTMGFVINRYLEILRFRPQDFWLITVTDKREKIDVTFNWKRHRLFDQHACLAFYSKIMECPKAIVTNVNGKQKSNWRPEPMYTTSMEKLASNKLRISAKEALDTAEKLYTQGYISYPRTETTIFPQGMNLNSIVEQQVQHPDWGNFAQRILNEGGAKPRQGKKTDNAHPPIHPTKFAHNLQGREKQLYELITRHFLACVSQDAKGLETIISIEMNSELFTTTGLIILERNYLDVYPYTKWNAKEIPKYNQGEEFIPQSVMMKDGKTSAPQLLTESELIALMEKYGIGTDATHAQHIETIQKREYVKKLPKNQRFCPTKLGLSLYDGYDSMRFRHLIKPELRARLENDLVKIAESTRGPRDVAHEYIEEHKQIFQVVDREKQKLLTAFQTNRNQDEPETRLKRLLPGDY